MEEICMPVNVLLIGAEPESDWVKLFSKLMHSRGSLEIASEEEAPRLTEGKAYDLLIVDAVGCKDEVAMVELLHKKRPEVPVFVVTSSPTWERARLVLLAGAVDYKQKTMDADSILDIIQK
jgi:DNA-binding NtrC family response regulator